MNRVFGTLAGVAIFGAGTLVGNLTSSPLQPTSSPLQPTSSPLQPTSPHSTSVPENLSPKDLAKSIFNDGAENNHTSPNSLLFANPGGAYDFFYKLTVNEGKIAVSCKSRSQLDGISDQFLSLNFDRLTYGELFSNSTIEFFTTGVAWSTHDPAKVMDVIRTKFSTLATAAELTRFEEEFCRSLEKARDKDNPLRGNIPPEQLLNIDRYLQAHRVKQAGLTTTRLGALLATQRMLFRA